MTFLDVAVVVPLCKSRLSDAAQSRCQAARLRAADKLRKYHGVRVLDATKGTGILGGARLSLRGNAAMVQGGLHSVRNMV